MTELSETILENQYLRAVVLPSFGGKIVSLIYKQNQFELIFQNPKSQFIHAPLYADFSDFEACGFDDAFPCIDGEKVDISGKKISYPDHGEIWTSPLDYFFKDGELFLSYRSKILDYIYSKAVYLSGSCLVCKYRIENIGRISFPCIWTAHYLVRYEPDMRFLYPAGTKAVEMTFDSLTSGTMNKKYHFPQDIVDGRNIDFTELPKTDKLYARKYYIADQIQEGYCGYMYPSHNMRAEFLFDPAILPYLGLWITSGGFRGDYNCAFEPSSGYYDKISIARANKRLDYLDPGETKTFSLYIKLTARKEKN
jgi:hypothetical protein